jgi:hypothetical protein
MADGYGADPAQVVDRGNEVVVKIGRAVPQYVARFGPEQQGSLPDGETRLAPDADNAWALFDHAAPEAL